MPYATPTMDSLTWFTHILCLSLRDICVWTSVAIESCMLKIMYFSLYSALLYSRNNHHLLNIIYVRVQQTLPLSKKEELWKSNHRLFINDRCSLFQQNIICDTEICISRSFHVIKTCSFAFLLTLKNKNKSILNFGNTKYVIAWVLLVGLSLPILIY